MHSRLIRAMGRPRICGLFLARTHRAAGRNPPVSPCTHFRLSSGPRSSAARWKRRSERASAHSTAVQSRGWPSGEIGSHSRLKICRRQLRVGSSPTSATIPSTSFSTPTPDVDLAASRYSFKRERFPSENHVVISAVGSNRYINRPQSSVSSPKMKVLPRQVWARSKTSPARGQTLKKTLL